MKRLFLLPVLFALVCLTSGARTLPRLKRIPQPVSVEVFDTIDAPRPDAVRFSGYEKTNPSNKETFFVTNNLCGDSTIVAFEVTVTYLDAAGKQLHERTEIIRCLLPAGQTRAVALPSWDSNHAFHYYLSTPPRSRRSSPFSVRSRLNKLILNPAK